jgi:ribosomal-protein-alanine N-acetyltransferase
LVNGIPGSGKTTLARRLAAELGVPLFGKGPVKEADVWRLLADSAIGGVVDGWTWPHDRNHVLAGLEVAGFDGRAVPEVWCDVPDADVRALGVGPAFRIDTTRPVNDRELGRLALQVRSAHS